MAKTNRRPSDKFERKQRLAQRPHRADDEEQLMLARAAGKWVHDLAREEDDEVADEISSPRTNRAY